jgi:sortase B
MKTEPKYLKKKPHRAHGRKSIVPILGGVLLALLVLDVLIFGGGMLMKSSRREKQLERPTESYTQSAGTPASQPEAAMQASTAPEGEPQTAAGTQTEQEPEVMQFLPYLEEKRQDNPDIVGWITIPDTKLDYPVMYTPEEPEKYLHLGIDGAYSFGGLPFIDANCSILPESDNLLIYGHNMLNGSMFRTIMKYEQKNFWQAHPEILLDLKDEQRTYEVIAAFRDRVYYVTEDCFKFYKFIDAESDKAYDEAISYFKSHTNYDTGLTAKRGDRLITLVTCASHTDNGRFVVVAREKRS